MSRDNSEDVEIWLADEDFDPRSSRNGESQYRRDRRRRIRDYMSSQTSRRSIEKNHEGMAMRQRCSFDSRLHYEITSASINSTYDIQRDPFYVSMREEIMRRFGQTANGNGTRNGEGGRNGEANGRGGGPINKEKTNGEVEKTHDSADEHKHHKHRGENGNSQKNGHVEKEMK